MELVAPFLGLALISQENGDHDRAIASIEHARGIVTVNYGLYSLEEVPLLRQLIRSEEARGDFQAAWDLEQELLALVRRYPGDPRTVPVYREIAGKRLDVLERYRAGELPPQIILGCYYNRRSMGSCHAGSRRAVIASLQWETSAYYSRAISAALRHEVYSSDELRALLKEVLPGDYRNDLYLDVESVFRRVLDYETNNPVSPLSRVDTLIQIADWNAVQLHRLGSLTAYEYVLNQYEQAYDELVKAGAEQASIDEIFAPTIPVVLPAFLPNPFTSEQTSDSTGYIDAAFDITKHGDAENIEILYSTENVIRRVENDLVKLIEGSPFRPRATNGELAETSPVVVRYYLRQ